MRRTLVHLVLMRILGGFENPAHSVPTLLPFIAVTLARFRCARNRSVDCLCGKGPYLSQKPSAFVASYSNIVSSAREEGKSFSSDDGEFILSKGPPFLSLLLSRKL